MLKRSWLRGVRTLVMETTRTPMDADVLSRMHRLERGEIVTFPAASFALPRDDDLSLLFALQLAALSKNISYDPATQRVSGFIAQGRAQHKPLLRLFDAFSCSVTKWLASVLPPYHPAWTLDRATFRSEEEATRRLRQTARNDLLHLDAFPNRPSQGRRILRVYVNVNPSEPRVWVTSEPFAKLLERYGEAAGLPSKQRGGWFGQIGQGVFGIFRPGPKRRTPYDLFMLRFHDFLKQHDEFQERGSKHLWSFAPGSVWMAMTDACSYAELRGRFALEHSYFVPQHVLALPDEAPATLLERAYNQHRVHRAA
jgi:3-deoxy-D-manno-oct-2-ulosonic acid (Kdo) hydroxylase